MDTLPTPSRTHHYITLYLGAFVVLVALAGAVYYIHTFYGITTSTSSSSSTTTSIHQVGLGAPFILFSTSTIPESDITNTYINPELGFSFRYPEAFTVYGQTPGVRYCLGNEDECPSSSDPNPLFLDCRLVLASDDESLARHIPPLTGGASPVGGMIVVSIVPLSETLDMFKLPDSIQREFTLSNVASRLQLDVNRIHDITQFTSITRGKGWIFRYHSAYGSTSNSDATPNTLDQIHIWFVDPSHNNGILISSLSSYATVLNTVLSTWTFIPYSTVMPQGSRPGLTPDLCDSQ